MAPLGLRGDAPVREKHLALVVVDLENGGGGGGGAGRIRINTLDGTETYGTRVVPSMGTAMVTVDTLALAP